MECISVFNKKKRKNMLVMKPILREGYRLEPSPGEEKRLTLVVPRTGWLERLSVRWLGQPEAIRVRLDELGSFVLSRCDGTHTVQDLADALEQAFGSEAEPVLPRLVQFLKILDANGWIRMTPPGDSGPP
jgi:hypothetical protein